MTVAVPGSLGRPARPASGQPRSPGLAVPVALAVLSLLALALFADAHRNFDIDIYWGAVRAWLHGTPLYSYRRPHSSYPFTYPPFAALLMLPMALIPRWFAVTVVALANAAVITGTTWWLARQVAPRFGLAPSYATACAVPLVCLLEPVRDTVGFGQIDLLLAALVIGDVVGLRRGSRWAGVGTGLAAAAKLTPALFVVLLFLRRPRAAVTAIAVGGLASTVAFAVAPSTSLTYWGSALFDTSRVGPTDTTLNQSLAGVLARLAGTPQAPMATWLPAVLTVTGLGLYRAARALRAGDDLAALALVGITGGLLSPITWVHHMWYLLPALAALLSAGATRLRYLVAAVGVALLYASSLPEQVRIRSGSHWVHGPFAVLAENSYVLTALVLVLLLPITASVRNAGSPGSALAPAARRHRGPYRATHGPTPPAR